MRRIAGIALLLSLIATGIVVADRRLWPVAIEAGAALSEPVRADAPAGPAKRIEPAQAAGHTQHDPYAAMRSKFETSSNFAAFIQDAMQRPMQGGRYFALLVYIRCQEVTTLRFDDSATVPEQLEYERAKAKLSELKRRCEGVGAQYPSESAFLSAIRVLNSKGEPDALLPAGGILVQANLESAAKELDRAIASREPYLIAAMIETHIESMVNKLSPQFARGENRRILHLATSAAVCEIVGDCKGGYSVTVLCATAKDCRYNDYRDWLASGLSPDERKLYEETRAAIVGLGMN